MAAILLKNVPPRLHHRLKLRAAAERRSLQQEVMLALERGLGTHATPALTLLPPVPIKSKFPITTAIVRKARLAGRP